MLGYKFVNFVLYKISSSCRSLQCFEILGNNFLEKESTLRQGVIYNTKSY